MRMSVRQITADVLTAVRTVLALTHASAAQAFSWEMTEYHVSVSFGSLIVFIIFHLSNDHCRTKHKTNR